jgi:hypothetical protein
VGSSPTRPTHPKPRSGRFDLRKCLIFSISASWRLCGCARLGAAKCGSLCPIRAQVQDRQRVAAVSVLPQCFADPALRQFVLADDAFGIDPQQYVHAVPGPLGNLGRVDAAVEPGGQAGVPQVVRAPGERRGLLRGGQGRLARFGPGPPVGDGRQLAAADTAEKIRRRRTPPSPRPRRSGNRDPRHSHGIGIGPAMRTSA